MADSAERLNDDGQPQQALSLVDQHLNSVHEYEEVGLPLSEEPGDGVLLDHDGGDDDVHDVDHVYTALSWGSPSAARASFLLRSPSPTSALPPRAATRLHHQPAGLGRWSCSRELELVPEEDEDIRAGETDDPAGVRESWLVRKYKDFKVEDEGEQTSPWSWVVLVCSCSLIVFILGIPPSFGVIYMEPLVTFGSQATIKSWIFNVGKALFFIAGCLSGPISTAFGHRILVIGVLIGALGLILSSFAPNSYVFFATYSVMESMGYGFAHFVCYLNLQVRFPKRRGLATGAYMASKACGRSLVPQLARYLSDEYGYRWMMRLLAALSLNGIVLGLVVTSGGDAARIPQQPKQGGRVGGKTTSPVSNVENGRSADPKRGADSTRQLCSCCRQQSRNQTEREDKRQRGTCCGGLSMRLQGVFDFGVFREPTFIALTMIDCLMGMTMENMSWALPFYAQERGFSPDAGALLLSVLGACDFAGRFLIPPLFDVKFLDYLCIFTVLLFVAAGASAGIGLQPSTEVTLALCGLFGLAQSGTGGMPNVLLIRYLSADRFPSTMSAKTLFKFGFFCLGPAIGFMVDATQSYSTCLFIFSGLLVLTAAMSALFPCCVKKCS